MDNTATYRDLDGGGGGVYSDKVTSVTISDSTFSGNRAEVRFACCHTAPFVLSFYMCIAMMTSVVRKMLFDIKDVDAMSACTPCSCCMLCQGAFCLPPRRPFCAQLLYGHSNRMLSRMLSDGP